MISLKIMSKGAFSEIYLDGHRLEGVQGIEVKHAVGGLPTVVLHVVADVECEQALDDRMLKKAPPKGWARRVPKYAWWGIKHLLGRSQVQDIYCHRGKDDEPHTHI